MLINKDSFMCRYVTTRYLNCKHEKAHFLTSCFGVWLGFGRKSTCMSRRRPVVIELRKYCNACLRKCKRDSKSAESKWSYEEIHELSKMEEEEVLKEKQS